MASVFSYLNKLNVMLDVVRNGLNSESPTLDAPPDTMKIQLREHQKAALAAMEAKEQQLSSGYDVSGNILYGDYAILGDSVGVGKSYMVLGHIARVMRVAAPLVSHMEIQNTNSRHFFSVKQIVHKDLSEAGCLIIVPHTLFRQWGEYIKQTNLKALHLDSIRIFNEENTPLATKIREADVVLISNTLYKRFSRWQSEQGIHWKRVFYDEMDTIHMTNGYSAPKTRFTWFITASWMNITFANSDIGMATWFLNDTIYNPESPYTVLAPYFAGTSVHGAYRYMRFYLNSSNYFRDYIDTTHPNRGNLVVRCDDAYIQESISLPPLYRQQILCRSTLSHRIVGDSVPAEVQELLHGGDVVGAMEALGIKAEDTTNLIDAVTKSLQKELLRLNQTLVFKSGLEYSTEASKETALNSLQEKIKRVQDQIDTIKSRIEGFKNEACPVCYDEPSEATVTPCCSQIFCGQCILACLTRSKGCPMCREVIHPNRLKRLGGNEIVEPVQDQLEKKSEMLLKIIRENPDGRFLIFSRYDNPFSSIERSVAEDGISVKQLKGNKSVISSTLDAFEKGVFRCLLLNAGYAGSGLNITAATHVILLHAMSNEEEKQILGRAYRMGRKGPLQFIKLLHADEITSPTTQ